jgi:hypothetical protein
MSRRKTPNRHPDDRLETSTEQPRRRITDAQVVEMVWAHSQCVKNQTGHCPLLVFGRQLAEELNAFFGSEE